jgi:hypothetical protein
MKPAIGVDTQGLAVEFLEIAWFLDGFEKTVKS